MSITVFGIPNCDQIKKSLAWFREHEVPVVFHDYKKSPPTRELLSAWLAQIEWPSLINRNGTTWRKLPDATKRAIASPAAALQLMLDQPSLIRRPVVVCNGRARVGYDPDVFIELLRSSR
jgi:arsenate reductase